MIVPTPPSGLLFVPLNFCLKPLEFNHIFRPFEEAQCIILLQFLLVKLVILIIGKIV